MENTFDGFILFLGVALIAFLVLTLLFKFFVEIYIPFATERDFIRDEIVRSYGEGRAHWENELKKLYMRNIPLIGGYLLERNARKRRKQFSEK